MTKYIPRTTCEKYIPRTTCEKLVKMGCVSESGFEYVNSLLQDCDGGDLIPAFTPWDFVGTSLQARENARILWVDMSDPYPCSRAFRHDCIDSKDAVEFIVRAVEAKEKVI